MKSRRYIRQWYDSFYSSSVGETGPWYLAAAELLSELEPNGVGSKKVLEVGCGTGAFISRLDASPAIGMDVSSQACQIARDRGVRVCVAPGESLPVRSSSFDIVVCCEVVEHVESPQRVLAEIHRVLKEGGLLLISTPNYLNLSWLFLRLAGDVLNKPNWTVRQPVDRLMTLPRLYAMVRKLGFRKVGLVGYVLEPPGIYHWRKKAGWRPVRSKRLAFLALHPVLAARKPFLNKAQRRSSRGKTIGLVWEGTKGSERTPLSRERHDTEPKAG
jgi:ubiquinone/menaquinone biosynthesis C-methylase UbiE